MPRPAKGARLWLRPADRADDGSIKKPARWVILDGGRQFGAGGGDGDRREAERALAVHIAKKYEAPRRERDLDAIPIADVVNIYLRDVAPGQARPAKAAERAERLLDFFGDKMLADINGEACRAYVGHRVKRRRAEIAALTRARRLKRGDASPVDTGEIVVSEGGARRDLQDLAAAIGHHHAEGLHRAVVRVVLPKSGEARKRWLSRDEFARLLWACRAAREVQEGVETGRRPLAHLCRYLLATLYTGSRPGAWLDATWDRGPGRAWVDVEGGRFYRQPEGTIANDKRKPPVTLTPLLRRLLAGWKRADGGRGHVVTFNGKPILSVKTGLATACRLAGLDARVTAYTLRHTAASWLIAKGLPTKKVAEFLGTSEAMIDAHYGHLAPDYQQAAAMAIGRK